VIPVRNWNRSTNKCETVWNWNRETDECLDRLGTGALVESVPKNIFFDENNVNSEDF